MGFVVLYLCFSGTWVPVVVEKNLLRVILCFTGFVVLYLCFSSTWVPVVVEKELFALA